MDHRIVYTTADEVRFLRALRDKSETRFMRYAGIVLNGLRKYDSTVDIAVVRAEILRLCKEDERETA